MNLFKIWPIIIICSLPIYAKENFAYRLQPSKDIALAVSGIGLFAAGNYLLSKTEAPLPEDIPSKNKLLPWDKKFAGRYSEKADFLSDVGAFFAIAPLVVGGVGLKNSSGEEFATFTVMFTEALAISSGINLAVRSLKLWPRPYIYSENPETKKIKEDAKGEAYGSFFSGHATAAFVVATFTDEWFRTIYPNSNYKNLVRVSAYTFATFESVLRVAAGKHYPSDILVGALVGSSVSYAILKIHKNENKHLSFAVAPNMLSVTVLF